jgi:hypothetical protein
MANQSMLKMHLRNTKEWPRRPVEEVPEEHRERYLKLSAAIEMRAEGKTGTEIFETTGVKDRNLCRVLSNAIKTNPKTGRIVGFEAAVFGFKLDSSYRRKVERREQDDLRETDYPTEGPGLRGMTFRRFPHIHEAIDDLFLKRASKGVAGSVAVVDGQFLLLELLRDEYERLGIDPETQWPFNTDDRALETLRRYRKKLLHTVPEQYIAATYGEQASYNLKKGTGAYSFFEKMPALSMRQLDFHAFDAPCILHVLDPNGCDMALPIKRFHVGIMVDRKPGCIHGFSVVFERTPSADAVLDTVDSCLNPRSVDSGEGVVAMSLTPDGNVTMSSLVPALRASGFAVIEMDNGLSNIAQDVTMNLMDVIGCMVVFGQAGNWWARPHIERLNGIFERRTGHRLPSTYGSHHKDVHRAKDPVGTAKALDVRVEDLVATLGEFCRSHNAEHSGIATHGQTIQHMVETLLANPASGVFVRPLPKSNYPAWTLFAHTQLAKVRGNRKAGVRPYIQAASCRYTNVALAQRFDLVGKQVVVSIHRRNANIAMAFVKSTHEPLGALIPQELWRNAPVPYAMRGMLCRFVGRQSSRTRRSDPMGAYLKALRETMGRGRGAGNVGLEAAKLSQAMARATDAEPKKDSLDSIAEPHPVRRTPRSRVPVPGLAPVSLNRNSDHRFRGR